MTALLALLPFALATQVTWDSAPLPGGDANARVFYKASGNTHGGWDSDLANYSTQGQWREYAISTCPDTLYSVYGFDMDKPLDDATAAAVTARLDALRKQYKLDAETIETWERYLVAGEVYKVLKKDPRFLAQLYLEASRAARDMAVGVYVGLEGPVAARELLDQGEKELLRQLPPRERKVLLHNLARVAHRGGFNADRDRYLKLFEQVGDLDADEQAALDTFRRVADTIEPQLQRLAVEQLKAYLASDPDDPVEVARATYLLADLARRLDQPRQAAQGYALVLTMSEAPPELRELSAFLGSLLDGEAPVTAARVYLILSAGVYLVLAAFFLLSPEEWAVKASLVADTPAGRAEIRAMYGGLELGIGAWLLVCAARERLVEVGLLTVAFTLGGLGTGRTLGLLGDPAGFSAHAPFLASEVTGTVGALVVLWWLRRSAT